MEKVKVKVINNSNNQLPEYKTPLSAGADLRAFVHGEATKLVHDCFIQDDSLYIRPMGRCLIDTGLQLQIPDGYEVQIRPRSGLTLNDGIICQLGTLDADYRGRMGLIIINFGNKQFQISNGDRLAQLIINEVKQADFELVDKLDQTDRAENGFGHIGVK